MKNKIAVWTIVLSVFLFSHYLHSQLNEIRSPYYNTVFSCPDLPLKFYQINPGESRGNVEGKIGKSFFKLGDYDYYSKSDNRLLDNLWLVFQIKYKNDTVVLKRVIRED